MLMTLSLWSTLTIQLALKIMCIALDVLVVPQTQALRTPSLPQTMPNRHQIWFKYWGRPNKSSVQNFYSWKKILEACEAVSQFDCKCEPLNWYQDMLCKRCDHISGIVENCHLKFPNFYEHFAIKIDRFWKLSVLIGELFIVPGGPEYYIDKKGTQKVTRVHIRKKKE